MADPPEDPAGHLLAAGNSLLSLQPAGHHLAAGNLPELLQPAGQQPLSESSEMELSGEPMPVPMAAAEPNTPSDSAAAVSKVPPPRPSMVAPQRIIKKKKSAAKSHPFHQLTPEEMSLLNPKDSAGEARENLTHRDPPALDMDEGGPRTVLSEVVRLLKTVAAEDVSPFERDDDVFSDDEDEEDEFDIESYHVDEKKRAELRSLMERYDVYDEEQLRLAIRRERKQGVNLPELAGKFVPPSASLPASPTHSPSRYIPPPPNKSMPKFGKIPSTIIVENNAFLFDSPAQSIADNTSPMQSISNPMLTISTPMQPTSHAMQTTLMHGHSPPQATTNPMQITPNPMHTMPNSAAFPMQHPPTPHSNSIPIQDTPIPMHTLPQATSSPMQNMPNPIHTSPQAEPHHNTLGPIS